MRTIIDLTAEQLEELGDMCRREGISRAEAIRQAVASHVRRQRAARPVPAFGVWRGRTLDSLAYERRLRREWSDTPSAASRKPRKRR